MSKTGKTLVIMAKMTVMTLRSDASQLKYSARPPITPAIFLFFLSDKAYSFDHLCEYFSLMAPVSDSEKTVMF